MSDDHIFTPASVSMFGRSLCVCAPSHSKYIFSAPTSMFCSLACLYDRNDVDSRYAEYSTSAFSSVLTSGFNVSTSATASDESCSFSVSSDNFLSCHDYLPPYIPIFIFQAPFSLNDNIQNYICSFPYYKQNPGRDHRPGSGISDIIIFTAREVNAYICSPPWHLLVFIS